MSLKVFKETATTVTILKGNQTSITIMRRQFLQMLKIMTVTTAQIIILIVLMLVGAKIPILMLLSIFKADLITGWDGVGTIGVGTIGVGTIGVGTIGGGTIGVGTGDIQTTTVTGILFITTDGMRLIGEFMAGASTRRRIEIKMLLT